MHFAVKAGFVRKKPNAQITADQSHKYIHLYLPYNMAAQMMQKTFCIRPNISAK